MAGQQEEGWWPDPGGTGKLRWWDGSTWTKNLRDLPPDPAGAPDVDAEWAPPTLPDEAVPADPTSDGGGRSGLRYLLGAVGVLLLACLVAGAFLLGQGTRKSDEQVATEQRAAVAVAVGATRTEERARRLRAVEKQKRRTRVVVRRVVHKMKKATTKKVKLAYASGQAAGYSSGNAAGYSSGNAAGYEAGSADGLVKGSDALTCSDDPDVSWLPYC